MSDNPTSGQIPTHRSESSPAPQIAGCRIRCSPFIRAFTQPLTTIAFRARCSAVILFMAFSLACRLVHPLSHLEARNCTQERADAISDGIRAPGSARRRRVRERHHHEAAAEPRRSRRKGARPYPSGGCVPVRPPSRRDHGDGLVQAGGRAGEWGPHRGERGALQYARPRAQRAPQSRDGARGEDWRERLWPPPLRERGRRRRS